MILQASNLHATQSEQVANQSAFTASFVETPARERVAGGIAALGRSTDFRIVEDRGQLRLKDRQRGDDRVPSVVRRAHYSDSDTTARAKLAQRMVEAVRGLSAADVEFAASKVQLLKTLCVEGHRRLAGGDQEDFLSLVVWIEGATSGAAWKQITAPQWESIQAALLTAYEAARYRYEEFVAGKRAMKAAGLTALPQASSVVGAD